jgi:hypothetical protein
MEDILVLRFIRFFASTDPSEVVLRPGSSGLACINLRAALGLLDIPAEPTEGGDRAVYDDELSAAVETFQTRYGHRAHDGLVGPGTRRLLTATILARFGPTISFDYKTPTGVFPEKSLSVIRPRIAKSSTKWTSGFEIMGFE